MAKYFEISYINTKKTRTRHFYEMGDNCDIKDVIKYALNYSDITQEQINNASIEEISQEVYENVIYK